MRSAQSAASLSERNESPTLALSYTSLARRIAALSAILSTSPCSCFTLSCHALFLEISSLRTCAKTLKGDCGGPTSSGGGRDFCSDLDSDLGSDLDSDSAQRREVEERGRAEANEGGGRRSVGRSGASGASGASCLVRMARRRTGRDFMAR